MCSTVCAVESDACEHTKRLMGPREMTSDKKHRLAIPSSSRIQRKSIDACLNYSSISQLVLPVDVCRYVTKLCFVNLFSRLEAARWSKKKQWWQYNETKERTIDRSRTSFSDSFSHSLERVCLNVRMIKSETNKKKARSLESMRCCLSLTMNDREGGGLSVRWPWGADIIFKLIEIEYKQFIVHSSKHR